MTMDPVRHALDVAMTGGTLDTAHAAAVMDAVMRGEVDHARFGAIFTMLHARGETIDELVGFAASMRSHVVAVVAPPGAIDTCGTGGDGAGTFNVSTCAAFVAVGAGAVVAKHGNRAVSSSCGSADVLEALGGRLDDSAAAAARTIADTGFAFLFAPSFHPSMRHAMPARRALGVRTAFNFLGPITNPAGVQRQVVGVSDADAAPRIARVMARLGTEHALVVHGEDGLDELTLAAASVIHEVRDGDVTTRRIEPESFGLERVPVSAIAGGDAERNAAIVREVLGGVAGAARDVVVLNAAAALVVAGIAHDLEAGVEHARRSIDDGNAAAALDRWIASAPGLEVVA